MAVSVYSVVLSLIIAVVLQKIIAALYRWIQSCVAARKFPGYPGTTFFLGDLHFDSFDDYMKVARNLVQTTGIKVNTVWVAFLYPYYSISHPDGAKALLKSSAPKDDRIAGPMTMLRPWIGNSILTHPGGKMWERNRHLLTPAFHFDILKDYVNVFNDVTDELLAQFSKAEKGKSIEVSSPITLATLDSLLRCALSYQGRIQETGQGHPYVDAVNKLANYYNDRIMNPFVYLDFIYYRTKAGRHFKELCDFVHQFAEDIIKKRRQTLNQTNTDHSQDQKAGYRKRRLDFLDVLLTARDDQGQGLTDLEIRAEVDTFLFAGHDTTSSALMWAVHALGKYPDVQKKVHEEVSEVVGDRKITWDDLANLRYLSLFIKEAMRMYSTVPFIGRVTDEPLTIDGLTIPVHSDIELNIDAINHRPDVWPDYEVFRPERFDEPSSVGRDPFSFIPFSAGARNCIGQNFATNEIKVMLTRLIQKYQIELDPNHEAVPTFQIVMRPKNGIKVFLHERSMRV